MVRRPGKKSFWLFLVWLVVYPTVQLLFRRRWRGLRNVPRSGPVILAANHVSHADPLTFARFVWDAGRIPRYLAKASLFRVFLVGRVIRGMGQIPVHRGTSDAMLSVKDARLALEQGEAICLYPEGTVTRDPDWWPMQPKTGVARLALSSRAPVIPVAQWGPQFAYDSYHKKVDLFPRKEVACFAGPAVDLSAYYDRPLTPDLLREVSNVIMSAVRDLLADIRQEEPPSDFYLWPPPTRLHNAEATPPPKTESRGPE